MIYLNSLFSNSCGTLVDGGAAERDWQRTAALVALGSMLLFASMGVVYPMPFVAKVAIVSVALSSATFLIFQTRNERVPRRAIEKVTPQSFVQHAISLQKKGVYIFEPREDGNILASNYPEWPSYLLCEFIVLFANWSKVESSEFSFLEKIARKNYEKGKLAMNCWQFVLLVMLETKAITVSDIENLYLYKKRHNMPYWATLWHPFKRSGAPEVGDIALFGKSEIEHAGIVTSIKPLKIIEMFNAPVTIRSIEGESGTFIPFDKAVQVIKELDRVEYNRSVDGQLFWERDDLSCYFQQNIFERQIHKELKKRFGKRELNDFDKSQRVAVAKDILSKNGLDSSLVV